MADLSEPFEEHLRRMTDAEWSALTARVRAPQTPAPPPTPLPNEKTDYTGLFGTRSGIEEGLKEARRRGYIDDEKKGKL